MTPPKNDGSICRLDAGDCREAVEVLSLAFHDYPVMRFVVGGEGDYYESGLRHLVELFTATRFPRGHPVIGLRSAAGELVGVASLDPPERLPDNSGTRALDRRKRAALGEAAVARLESFESAEDHMLPNEPHYYLGMLGVLPSVQGTGMAKLLLDAVHEISRLDPLSTGVALTTELPQNVELYEYFGYLSTGKVEFEAMTSWGFFRPDSQGEAS